MEIIAALEKTFLVGDNTFKKITMSTLIKDYSPLAKNWCAKYIYTKKEYEYEDMLQETNIAIINAYESYRLDFHVSIGYYLNTCIKNALNNYCAANKYKKI